MFFQVILLVYHAGLAVHTTSAAALGVYGGVTVTWFFVETAFFDRWTRYTFSVYPVVAWTACGIIARENNLTSPVAIAALSVLGSSVMALVVKVPLVVWRSYSRPLYIEQTIPHKIDLRVSHGSGGITTILWACARLRKDGWIQQTFEQTTRVWAHDTHQITRDRYNQDLWKVGLNLLHFEQGEKSER